jgi:uncharacterized repeat protein (TIGR01451 family)
MRSIKAVRPAERTSVELFKETDFVHTDYRRLEKSIMRLTRALSIPFVMLLLMASVTAALGQSSVYNGQSAPASLTDPDCTGVETVLLIQDVVPWFAPPDQDPGGADFTELGAQKENFCAINSNQLAGMNLSGFKQIVIASAQTQTFYNNLFPNGFIASNLAAWVQNGGFLIAHLADSASGPGMGGTWSGDSFVGGLQHSGTASNDDDIADPSNALIADSLPCPSGNCGVIIDDGQFTDLDGWGFSDHGFFTSLPSGTIAILTQVGFEGPGAPVTIQYPYGSGTVLATLTTIEFRYVGGFGSLPRNKKLLANEFAYPNVTTTQTGGGISQGNPASLTQQFVFNAVEGQLIQFDFDYLTASNSETLTVPEGTVPTVTNNGITQDVYTQMVQGTALATTSCFLANGQKDATGNSLCTTLTLECTNASNPTLAGDNCPQSTARNLLFKQAFDTSTAVSAPPPGFAFTLAMGSDTWSPGNCTLTGAELNQLCPRSLLTELFVSGDPTTKGGGTGKTSNSTFVFGCCEPEWQTMPKISLWNRTTTVPVSFQSNPPPRNSTNGYRAAQGQSVTFGSEGFGATPDPTFPVAGDQTVMNSSPCPSSPDWLQQRAAAFRTKGSVTVPGEGAWELHYFSTDCDDMEELNFTKPTGPLADTQNWASFKTVPFNVDLTPPTVSNLVLNPPPVNGTYQFGQTVTATLTCTDPVHNGVASGIAICGSANTNGANPVTVTVPVPTSTPGQQTFGATDVAGNSTVAFSYTVVAADLDVIELGPLFVRPGSSATYVVGAWNKGPSTASNVVVSGVVPTGETLVSASFAPISMTSTNPSTPVSATPCSVNGNSFSCLVGTLAPIPAGARSFTGIGVKVSTTVNANVKPGTVLKNTAAVNSDTPNPDKDTVFTWLTWVISN